MKSNEQKIAEAIASLTARLTEWGVEGAPAKAHEFVRDMLDNGWRTTRAERLVPPPGRPADPETRSSIAEQLRTEQGWSKANPPLAQEVTEP